MNFKSITKNTTKNDIILLTLEEGKTHLMKHLKSCIFIRGKPFLHILQ